MTQLYDACTLGELLIQAINRYPDRRAVVCGSEQLTYGELACKVSQLVQHFNSLGFGHGDGLAMISGNCVNALVVSAAAHISGMRYTPLHPLGSAEDHAFCLKDAEVKVLVVDDKLFKERGRFLKDAVDGLGAVFSLGQTDFAMDINEAFDRFKPQPLADPSCSEDVCFIGYTGGTTGKPKGVVHTNKSIVSSIMLSVANWEWPDRPMFLATTPVSHSAGSMIFPTLILGGTAFLQQGYTPEGFLKQVQQNRISVTFMVPSMIYALLDFPGLDDYDITSLETVIYGAAPISQTRLHEALEKMGPIFAQLYGQTEAPNCMAYLRKDDHGQQHKDRTLSCGYPMPGIQVRLLDEKNGAVKQGETGEICVRGPLVMRGYWKRPEQTEEVFEGEWLHSGDMAYEDEYGYLFIVDRKKDMIISGGFNVFPKEIEDVLTAHPAVSNAAVIGVPDEKWGEKVLAIVVLRPGESVEESELIDMVKTRKGAVYAPKQILFENDLPVTALGKPDKKQLRKRFWSGSGRKVN